MRRAVLIALLLLLPGSSLFAFWPISWELDGQKNFLGPLISYEEEGEQSHVTVRPFLSSYDSPDDYTLLFPLGKSTPEKSYFVPFYMRHAGECEHDTALFPFFWGETADGRSYGGVFPFYGKLYDRFRRDEMGFFLWPLYGYSVGDSTTKTDFLWPFFSFYHGHEEGFKLGPLYGQRHWGDERKSSFVLWPFFIKDEKFMNTDNPTKSVWAIPFYMQTESPKASFHAVLWPFFTWAKVQERREVKAPWPIFSYTSGQKEQGFSIWPVYSHDRTGADEVTYVLWPIYKEWERHPGDDTWSETRILLLDRYTIDDRGTFFNIWPFFEYRSDQKDEQTFFFPSLLPWRNNDFDRIMRPLLTLYEYRKTGEKTVSNLLYGLYTKEEEGETWKRRLAFLFEVKREKKGMGFQVLSGLFGVDSTRIKLFYIPIKRKQAPEQAGEGLMEEPREQAQANALEESPDPSQEQPQQQPDQVSGTEP
jgi:hypothetical protein